MNFKQFFSHYHWWGKILGALFGYLIAGAPGVLFGILIGNLFDRGIFEHFQNVQRSYYKEQTSDARPILLYAIFSVMGYIAKADGHISKEEIKMAQAILEELRLTRQEKISAKQSFNEGKQLTFDLAKILRELELISWQKPDLLKFFIDIQYRASKIGPYSEAKLQALDQILHRLGFAPLHQQYRFYEDFGFQNQKERTQHQSSSHSNYYAGRNHSTHSLAAAYALLEVSMQASQEEVKKAYRRLISRHHPDKLIAKGMPDQIIKQANEKTQKIRKAYEQICASRGW